uniref:CSD domain-containing protein n=2 Tax=Eukaryota TaxID=2759 RepID=A0A7S1SY55_9CHLO|mmetsp:Transcript_35727/g.63713  ORF Transcript_35727/g.63713 Transcript_35727/m.63713 type:complete len:145 (+) Transcript_35727:147-581(+)|eukprot:CAMPEP_0168619436 /NCGR_PEP_ID=MMETSP0449_2-20121227/6600_1 /TAXON_ID=1082188 /ORGANISM="Strombidium rassoulzadegani, Strain ras09" /LENGTH=144 /DNA_ID=CAMNT_0008660369 /DNA_START=27 /DNA_END=461 /DNA_ORIENTATION=+
MALRMMMKGSLVRTVLATPRTVVAPRASVRGGFLPAMATSLRSFVAAAGEDRLTGTVKWFDSTKGYGFISPANGSSDVFVHQSVIHAPGFRSLAEGEEVEFVVEEQGNGKVRAADVTGPNGDFVKGQQQQRGGRGDYGNDSYQY